jgi:hypothetical protein
MQLIELSHQGQQAADSPDYLRGRKDGYAIGLEHRQEEQRLADALRYFAAGMLTMAAILLPWLWPAA